MTEDTTPAQDPDATAPSDPATPEDPDNGDPHTDPEPEPDQPEPDVPDVQVNADEADVTVNGGAEPEAD